MDHKTIKEKIYKLIEFEVSDKERREMLRHINSCPECKEEYDAAVRLNSLYKSQPMEPLPHGYYDRLYAKLPVDPRTAGYEEKSPWWQSIYNFLNFFHSRYRLSLGVAVIIMIAVGWFFFMQYIAPPPPRLAEPAMYLSFGDEDVEFYDKDTDSWKSDDKVTELKTGDKLKTKNSRAIIAIDKTNNIRLAPDTEIEVAKMSKVEKKTRGKLKLKKGRIWIEEKTAASLMVEAGNYLIKPIGTQYDVYRDNTGKTTVSVYQGKVEVELLRTGKKIDLDAGEKFTSYQTKKKSKKQIEKMNPDTVEKNNWYKWNRKVEIPKLPETGYKMVKPTLRKKLPTPPPWIQAQQGSRRSSPLMLPHSRGDWQKFRQQRQEWRRTHRRTGMPQKRPGIPQVEQGQKSMPQYPGIKKPGGDRRPRIPGEKGQKEPMGIPQVPGSTKGTRQIPQFPGQVRHQHPGQGKSPFTRLPQNRRKQIIDRLKQQGKLPHDYPGNAKSLPTEAERYLKQKMMQERRKKGGLQQNPRMYKGQQPGMQKGQGPGYQPQGTGQFKRPPGSHKGDMPADKLPHGFSKGPAGPAKRPRF